MQKFVVRHISLIALILALPACLASDPSSQPNTTADPMDAALAAYKRNDSETAARMFLSLAEQGNDGAQIYLAGMYWVGSGVPKDIVRAYMWWNVAASSKGPNERQAAKARDDIAKSMTPVQISQAQELTNACLASKYKQCGRQGAVSTALPTSTQSAPPTFAPRSGLSSSVVVPMKRQAGTYVVPVHINNALTLDFTVDSGAADVSIPADVVMTLVRTGTIRDTDFIGEQTYVLADGSRVKSHTFRIRTLQVGDRVIDNVLGSVAPVKGSLLLGQSFLGRFKSWSIDNSRHALVLE